jgi:hypothetical protein
MASFAHRSLKWHRIIKECHSGRSPLAIQQSPIALAIPCHSLLFLAIQGEARLPF